MTFQSTRSSCTASARPAAPERVAAVTERADHGFRRHLLRGSDGLPLHAARGCRCHARRGRYYIAVRYTTLRRTDPGLLVLASLAGGPKHGYAITQDVEQMADVRLGPGTLYGALARLEDNGLIAALPAQDRKRPYELTERGRDALAEQLKVLGRVASAGLDRLRVAGAPT